MHVAVANCGYRGRDEVIGRKVQVDVLKILKFVCCDPSYSFGGHLCLQDPEAGHKVSGEKEADYEVD